MNPFKQGTKKNTVYLYLTWLRFGSTVYKREVPLTPKFFYLFSKRMHNLVKIKKKSKKKLVSLPRESVKV